MGGLPAGGGATGSRPAPSTGCRAGRLAGAGSGLDDALEVKTPVRAGGERHPARLPDLEAVVGEEALRVDQPGAAVRLLAEPQCAAAALGRRADAHRPGLRVVADLDLLDALVMESGRVGVPGSVYWVGGGRYSSVYNREETSPSG